MADAGAGASGRTAVEASDLRDRLHEARRQLDIRLWTRLLPAVAVVAWCVGLVVLSINPGPAGLLAVVFGLLAWLELRWRRGSWSRIREIEQELERLEAGEPPPSSRA